MRSTRRLDFALVLLRVAVGAVFTMHGLQKLFVMGPEGVAGFFASVGIPFAGLSAVVVTGVELVGGLALLAGLFTRWVGPLLTAVMGVAIATVHLPNGFFLPNGYEFALTLLLANAALTLTGAGAYSIDAWLSRRPEVRVEPARRERLAA